MTGRWIAALLFLSISPGYAGIKKDLDRLVLTVLDVPKSLAKCGGKDDVQQIVLERFSGDRAAPKLGKGGEMTLPLFELGVETRERSPKTFRALHVRTA
jgi:hypothetical protein